MTYGQMLFGVILASACLASAMMGYGYEVLPNVRFLSGSAALLLGGSSASMIAIFIGIYKIDKRK